MIQLKRNAIQKIVIIFLSLIIASMGIGCDINEDSSIIKQKFKVYSNEKLIRSFSYSNFDESDFKTDEQIAKVGTYKQLLSILYSINIFQKQRKSFGDLFNDGEILIEESISETTDSNTGHSETNTQVSGVDEADLIKNDDQYIYYLSDGELSILDASKELPELVSKMMVGDNTQMFYNMFISGDILILSGGKYVSFKNRLDSSNSYADPYDMTVDEYDESWNSFTVFALYDISNRKAPQLKRMVEIDGNEVSTRLIGNNLYFVTNKQIPYIRDYKVNDYEILPMYKDTADSTDIKVIQPKDISYFPDNIEAQYMLVGTFDITKDDAVVPQAYLGSGSDIYMNTNSLYVSKKMDQPRVSQGSSTSEAVEFYRTTQIYRFSIEENNIKFVGIAEVDGHLINQYSMDEYRGILRVATGSFTYGNGITTININTMKPIATISGLAVNEQIHSVRFMGNVGYMVTYRNVDPLFVFDLSNPMEPLKTGELKIPGFSQYLHPVGDNYLVGFGRNTEEEFYLDTDGKKVYTGVVRDKGFKLSLFDVSDLYNPKEVFVKTYAEGSTSPVSNDPHSIMVDTKNDIFAFPILLDDGWSENGKTGTVVKIDPFTGFITLTDAIGFTNNIHASRFCYIGDKLYFISNDNITVYSYPECEFIDKVSF